LRASTGSRRPPRACTGDGLLGTYLEKDEIIHILICAIAISFAFAFIFAGTGGVERHPWQFMLLVFIAMVTIGSGFILHEMGHKISAIMFGAKARYRMSVQGLLVMMGFSLMGFLFAAPGAVVIESPIDRRQFGIVSMAGPLVNIALVAVFLALSVIVPLRHYLPFEAIRSLNVWMFGAQLNLILALFNMIPVFPLDGSKVLYWSKAVWLGVTLVLLALSAVMISPLYVFAWVFMCLVLFILSRLFFR